MGFLKLCGGCLSHQGRDRIVRSRSALPCLRSTTRRHHTDVASGSHSLTCRKMRLITTVSNRNLILANKSGATRLSPAVHLRLLNISGQDPHPVLQRSLSSCVRSSWSLSSCSPSADEFFLHAHKLQLRKSTRTMKQNSSLDCKHPTKDPPIIKENPVNLYIYDEFEDYQYDEFYDPKLKKILFYSPFLQGAESETLNNPLLSSLSKCENIDCIFETLEKYESELTIEAVGCAVSHMWRIMVPQEMNIINDVRLPVLAVLTKYENNPTLLRLLMVVESEYRKLDDDRIVHLVTHLHAMGLSTETPAVRNMFSECVRNADSLSLVSITKIFQFLRNPNLNYITKGKFVPRVQHFLRTCSNASELQLINFCLSNCRRHLSETLAQEHALTLHRMIDTGRLMSDNADILIKTMDLISTSQLLEVYESVLRKIGSMLLQNKQPLPTAELLMLGQFCRVNKHDRFLINKLYEQSAREIREVKSLTLQAKLYLLLNPRVAKKWKQRMEIIVRNLLKSPDYASHMQLIYVILRLKTVSDFSIINEFWEKNLELAEHSMNNSNPMQLESSLAVVHQQYLHFNNNLGGTYRNIKLENKLRDYLLKVSLRHQVCVIIFYVFISFIKIN